MVANDERALRRPSCDSGFKVALNIALGDECFNRNLLAEHSLAIATEWKWLQRNGVIHDSALDTDIVSIPRNRAVKAKRHQGRVEHSIAARF